MLSKKKAIFHAISFVLISSFSNFSLAFKPTANHGHAGITQEGIAIVERTAESGESLRFSNLDVRHGSKINIVGSDGEVIINSQGPVTVGNMSVVNPEDSKRITVYSNTDQEIYIGHDSSFEGILIAPHGKVVIASRAKAGYIEARHIELQADAQLSGN